MKIIQRWFLWILLACMLGGVQAQDTNYARYIIRSLTSDAMHGRGPGYRGDSIAASFLRNEMVNIGLQPLGQRYYQPYTYSTHSMEGPCWMTVNGRQLKVFDEFRPTLWSTSVNSEKLNFVNLPAETLMDSVALQAFLAKKRQRLADCFVFIDVSLYDPLNKDKQRQLNAMLRQLQQRNIFGCQGIIVAVRQLSTVSPAGCERIHDYAYVEVLAKSLPKKIRRMGLGIQTHYIANYQTQNVCGYVPGEVDTMIVYTAHYDHVGTMGISQTDGKEVIFRGAHDNASGVAAVMDLARSTVAEKPHYTTVFLLFSGEEAGLKGSTYAASHPLIDLSKVRLLINIDMFCGGEEGLMVFNATSPETKAYFDRMVMLNKSLEVAREIRPRDNRANSDHYPFSDKCPSLFVLTMGGPYGGYHDPKDDCAGCGLEYYQNYLVLISTLGL